MENIPVCNLNFALPVCRMKVKMQQQLLQLQSPRLRPGILKRAACKINSTRSVQITRRAAAYTCIDITLHLGLNLLQPREWYKRQ